MKENAVEDLQSINVVALSGWFTDHIEGPELLRPTQLNSLQTANRKRIVGTVRTSGQNSENQDRRKLGPGVFTMLHEKTFTQNIEIFELYL